jgi:ABC-2 type transport system ATP-binding protein
MMDLLTMGGVSKRYGTKTALQNINLKVANGKIIGLVGSNGSGKTTLLKLIAGLLHPTEGSIRIEGKEVGTFTKQWVSFMPDEPYLNKWMKVSDAVAFYQNFFSDFDNEKAVEILDFLGIEQQDKVASMSKGAIEKLQLALTLSRKVKLYLLDEPLGGIDPVAREKILDAIIQFYDEDSTTILSTHLIRDVERIFDEVIFLKDGECILHEDAEALRFQKGKAVDELFKEVYGE